MNETQDKSGLVQRRRTRTRAALLDAAERAFMREGFHAVRIEAIAEEAEVSVGSIYNLFSNKAGLYLAVTERATELFGEYLDRAYRTSQSPLEQVMACGDAYLRFHLEHPGAFRFIAFEGVESRPAVGDDDARARVTAQITAVLEEFRDRIAAAVAAGEANASVDPALTSRVLFGAWNGMVALALRHDDLAVDDDEISAVIEQARRIVLDGLTDPAHRDEGGRSRAHLLTISHTTTGPLDAA
jgi:AcrR family transcriptional regulator